MVKRKSVPYLVVSARNGPCVESREVQMGKADHGDAFHASDAAAEPPIAQDAFDCRNPLSPRPALRSFTQNTPQTARKEILPPLSTEVEGFFFYGCVTEMREVFPEKRSLLRSSAPPLNI